VLKINTALTFIQLTLRLFCEITHLFYGKQYNKVGCTFSHFH